VTPNPIKTSVTLVKPSTKEFFGGRKFSKFLIYWGEKRLVPCMKRDGMDLNSFSMERIQIV
jgi:hypothetical protein